MTPERQNRKARRTLAAQTRKGQKPEPTDGSRTITGKAYTRGDRPRTRSLEKFAREAPPHPRG